MEMYAHKVASQLNFVSLVVRALVKEYEEVADLLPHETDQLDGQLGVLMQMGLHTPSIMFVGEQSGSAAEYARSVMSQASIAVVDPATAMPIVEDGSESGAIRVVRTCLGSYTGTVEFVHRVNPRLSSPLFADPRLIDRNAEYEVTRVSLEPITTLDHITGNGSGLRVPDALIIDTQGFDLEVLRGSSDVLSSGGVHAISCEVYFAPAYRHQFFFHELLAWLERFGYRLHRFNRLVQTPTGALYFGNATFLSSQARTALGVL